MDNTAKNHILNDCNNYSITLDDLDNLVREGHITIEEFTQHNLEISKVKELQKRKNEREGITDIIVDVKEDEKIIKINGNIPPSETLDEKSKLLKEVKENTRSAIEIYYDIVRDQKYTFDDLEEIGFSKRAITALKYQSQAPIRLSYSIDDLPAMEQGRTDVFFVGVPASGKTVMLGGLLKYANKKGIIIPDSYNNAGNVFQADLIKDLDVGFLPKNTDQGSYNYIATSIQDNENINHPFNIVEVPGENYIRLFNEGSTTQTDYIVKFMKYIKNSNKKILIFVIDSVAHENRNNLEHLRDLDQSIAYVNILNMFRDHGVLEQTDAIYLVANKFDVLLQDRYMLDGGEHEKLALDFIQEEFTNLITNCKYARDNSRNKFKIKVFPFSIGEVHHKYILENYNNKYSKAIVDNLLEDSFIVKGGRFWKKLF